MAIRNVSVWKSVDWFTIIIYLLLLTFGWFSICGASYSYTDYDFFDMGSRSGKQLMWIFCSFGLSFVLLMLEDKFYDVFSYFMYAGLLLLLAATIFLAEDVKGSHSWLKLGSISLQPAEFAKFGTALALAKFMGHYNFSLKNLKDALAVGLIIFVPMILIILQRETGSALVYFSFFLMLYREGMPGAILFTGVSAVVYFVVGIKYQDVMMLEMTSVGKFAVLSLILFFSEGLIYVYSKNKRFAQKAFFLTLLVLGAAYLISSNIVPFNMVYLLLGFALAFVVYLIYTYFKTYKTPYLLVALFTLGSIGFLYSTDYVFNKILEPHQRIRIEVLLGMEEDLTGAGYNVNQSKIAIGSGGLKGKGFLNGTQTKLKYVPEQDTDFIFCTVGEEQGFLGSALVLILFLTLILRLIFLSERQKTTFGRVYGYSIASIFLFHLFINIGMVLGLTPVIGIPLPFFSYGGSSLWGFTLLLFIFLRLDAGRSRIL